MIFHIKNNSASVVRTDPQPWEYTPSLPAFRDKKDFRHWCVQDSTDHYFYSAFEGLNASARIGKENPPYRMHGLIADYDSRIEPMEARGSIKANSPREFLPAWISITYSGGVRLYWEFEEPVFTYSAALLKEFLKRLQIEFKCARLLPGLDPVINKPDLYYEVGSGWGRFSEVRIPKKTLDLWIFQAGSKIKWRSEGEEIPLELVALEVEKQFPGKWKGDFVEGARGCRFWDPVADNDTAAVVRSAGMQCFTGDKAFVPWGSVLGAAFTREYQANRVAAATDQIFYDNRHYWQRDDRGDWNPCNLESLQLYLRVDAGLSRETGKATFSEVDAAVRHIQRHSRVVAALPFVHRPKGLHRAPDGLYLNTSNISVCPPADGSYAWGEEFPWLARFFDGFFSSEEQSPYFFAWLQRFYKSAYEQHMEPGHAVFVAGTVGQGKTLLGTKIIGPMMGGAADATSYLLGKSDWNSFLFSRAVWNVDDPEPGRDPKAHAIYSASLKKHVANQEFDYQQKFRDGGRVTWTGRTIITLNSDEVSLGMLPEMDISVMDKINFFRAADRKFNFAGCEGYIEREMPFFCRWLLDWEAPEDTRGSHRYGVKEYHEPSLLAAAQERGRTSEFRELLEIFLVDWFRDSKETEWKGSSAQLYSEMMLGATKDLVRRMSTHALTKNLKMLLATGGDGIQMLPGRSRRALWVLDRSLIGDLADEKSAA